MLIGDRLRSLREHKNLSQGDVENRSGLMRMYISRVENGHTVPSIETLEKFARALEVPMYALFYEGEQLPAPKLPKNGDDGWGSFGRHARTVDGFRRLLGKASKPDRKLLMFIAQRMSQRKTRAVN